MRVRTVIAVLVEDDDFSVQANYDGSSEMRIYAQSSELGKSVQHVNVEGLEFSPTAVEQKVLDELGKSLSGASS